jgi:hypothetical protein
MEEKESVDRDVLSNAVYLAAQHPDGFKLRVNGDEKLLLALTGKGEFTLWISSQSRGEWESPAPQAEPTASPEKRRLTVAGNVASQPRYGHLPRRGLRVGFRFGEHTEVDGERRTTFWDAYSTGKFAEAIRKAGIALGDELAIHGELQRTKVVEGGKERIKEQLYCYGVRLRKRAK